MLFYLLITLRRGHTANGLPARPAFSVQGRGFPHSGSGRILCKNGAHLLQRLGQQRHARGADLGHTPAQLILRDGLAAIGVPVGEVVAHRAVEMDVRQAGDGVAPPGVQHLAAAVPVGQHAAVHIQVPADKGAPGLKYLRACNFHRVFLLAPPGASVLTVWTGPPCPPPGSRRGGAAGWRRADGGSRGPSPCRTPRPPCPRRWPPSQSSGPP